MAGEQMKWLWALIFLLGLLATSFLLQSGNITEMVALWIWFALLVVANYGMGMKMKSVSAKNIGMGANVVFIFLGLTLLLGLWGVPNVDTAAVMFALSLVLTGGAMFGMGHELKNSGWMAWGLTTLAFGIVFPTWFNTAPFLGAALVIGLPWVFAVWKKMM